MIPGISSFDADSDAELPSLLQLVIKWNARRMMGINRELKHRYLERWYLDMLRRRHVRLTCGAMEREVDRSHTELQCVLRELSELRQFKDVVINSAGTESLVVKRVRRCSPPVRPRLSSFLRCPCSFC